ncbi:MAG: flagellin [Oceanicaulis sp.]|jgi:flagellin|uniref:flagellin n=1 Tax=unclassified Oceanicaulis TaxID=2632123 RepID=UPI000066D65E|nr:MULTISPECIES: flagellin [unclassified Oceanicaulis]EAP91498.1 flagellin FljM [Oceanicaulis sp. HTCC2633]MAB69817.1 flagellin [Oceanicaulis sp.]MBC39849.1 flagellin [Oceanicaulis sp.]HCR94672.1 flagellin [Oceanicaulis sp.]|tara:strand:+ start:173 stop:1000 length:828 start_codon:yes stop_codon:yes gene_type:complete
MATINTNPGAMVALQNLNQTNKDLQQVQQRINTGLAISSAKDNGGVFAIAQSMRADVAGYKAVGQSLDLAQSTVDVALAAGEAISDLLVEMKEKALAGADSSLDTASRNALNEDFKALRDQIGTIVANAEFNGTNLINGTQTGGISALANADGSNTLNVGQEIMSLGGTNVTVAATASFTTAAAASGLVATIETSLDNLNTALAKLGTGSKSLEVHKTFVGKLSDSLEKGIGNLVDADLAKESARLQSLQVKQQLGTQALSIANSAPSNILGYFR